MLFERNPSLQSYFDRVKALPRLKNYYADDNKCIKRPYNGPMAKLNNNDED